MGSGEGNHPSHSIIGAMLHETPSLGADPDKHSGGVCMSPAKVYEFCDRWCPDKIQGKGPFPQAHSSDEDPERHGGRRCLTPDRQFKCEGWCHKGVQRNGSLPHADVVRRVSKDFATPAFC